MDYQSYLAGKGHHGRRASGTEVTYPCFFDCNEPNDATKRKLYVNAETGLYDCKVCLSQGNHVQLMRHFGDEPDDGGGNKLVERIAHPSGGRRSEALECATVLGEKMLRNSEEALTYLLGDKRHLDPEVLHERRLGWAARQWPLTRQLNEEGFSRKDCLAAGLLAESQSGGGDYEYYADRILIPYIENGRVVQLRGKDIHGRYYTPIGDPVYLYNVDALTTPEGPATDVVIVEGEFDTIMLAGLLATSEDPRIRATAVVGIAGTGAIPDDFAIRLSHARRVFIGTDPDEAGRRAAEKLQERLGNRGHIIEWPEHLITAHLNAGRELKTLDWTEWIGGYGATLSEVAELLRVRGRLVTASGALARHLARPTHGLKTGFTGLDAAFLPGLLPGQVCVMLARTGVGKTLLLCNLAYNMRSRRVLFITLEMTAEEIWVRIARVYRFYEPWASDASVAYAYRLLRICDSNRLSEDDFANLVEEYTDDVGDKPEAVFVDYLGYYARGRAGGNAYEKVTDAVMQLKAEGKTHGLTVITPAQVNRGAQEGKPIEVDDARDSGAIEETADLLVGAWRADDALDLNHGGIPSGKLHLKVLKSRHGNRDRVFLLQMGLHSLVILDDTSPLAEKARRESQAVFRGETYEQYLTNLRNYQPQLTRR